MPSEEQKQLANAIKPLLKEAGFKKTAFNWRRKVGNVVQVFNFQGSQWSNFTYVNLGVYFLDIGIKEKPTASDCHIWQRLTAVSPDLSKCNELFNFESSISDAQRYAEVSQLVNEVALPWFERFSTKERAKQYLQSENKNCIPVSVIAEEYLGLDNH